MVKTGNEFQVIFLVIVGIWIFLVASMMIGTIIVLLMQSIPPEELLDTPLSKTSNMIFIIVFFGGFAVVFVSGFILIIIAEKRYPDTF